MATLDDLSKLSISEMTAEEAIELIRQIRLSRRTVKRKKPVKTKSVSSDAEKSSKKLISSISAKDAIRLLEMLTEGEE